MEDDAGWRLDKRLPLSMLLTVVLQTLVLVWFLAGMNFQIASHEKSIDRLEGGRYSERVAVLESHIGDIRTSLVKIQSDLNDLKRSEDDEKSK